MNAFEGAAREAAIVVVIAAIVSLLLGGLGIHRRRRSRWDISPDELPRLAHALAVPSLGITPSHLSGTTATIRARTATRHREAYVEIEVAHPSGISFELRLEAPSDRATKALGLAVEPVTGDAEFDRAVYIEADDPAVVAALRRDELRAGVWQALAGGVERIRASGRKLWARWSPPPTVAEAPRVRETALLLARLAQQIDRITPTRRRAASLPAFLGGAFESHHLLEWVPMTALFLGFFSIWNDPPRLFLDDVFGELLLLGALAGCAWTALAVSILRSRAEGARRLPIIAPAAICGFAMLAPPLTERLNRWTDRSQPVFHVVDVLETKCRSERRRWGSGRMRRRAWRRPDAEITVVSWRDPNRSERLYVPFALCNANPASLRVIARVGGLGYEWAAEVTERPTVPGLPRSLEATLPR